MQAEHRVVVARRAQGEDRTPEDRTPEDRAPEDRAPGDRERGAISLVAVVGLFALALALALATLTANLTQLEHARDTRADLQAQYVALAAANEALSEVRGEVDGTGERGGGLGVLGVTRPLVFTDAAGVPRGEYRAYVVNKAQDPATDPPLYYLRAMAAAPSFAALAEGAPDARACAVEVRLTVRPRFALAPDLGAISVSGPVDAWALPSWDNGGFTVDGDGSPAIVFTDAPAYEGFVDRVKAEWGAGWRLGQRITGSPLSTHNEGEADEFDAPIRLQSQAPLEAQLLNDYREALRGYAEGLAHVAPAGGSKTTDRGAVDRDGRLPDGTILLHLHPDVKDGAGDGQPRIARDLALGDAEARQTVVIDTSRLYQGGANATDNHSRRITGAGTLIILHPIGSSSDNANGKQFDLDWQGDVFVLGYPDDTARGVGENRATDNLLFISRADWKVAGNVFVLSSGQTEASLELNGTGSDPASLTVDGALMLFAEATGREAEIDIEASASLTVNGIIGVYGKRAELESQDAGAGTSWTVNGTLAIGLPADVTTSVELQVGGVADLGFDLGRVQAAAEGLAALQRKLSFTHEVPQGREYAAHAWLTRGAPATAAAFVADLDARRAAGLPRHLDLDLLQRNH